MSEVKWNHPRMTYEQFLERGRLVRAKADARMERERKEGEECSHRAQAFVARRLAELAKNEARA